MEITNVNIHKIEKEGSKVKAIASVLLDNCFAIHDIRILENNEGELFIAMPSRKTSTGSYRDIAHPINPETRKIFEERIISEFKNAA